MAPHSSTLAWKIPQTEEPGGLQSMGSLRVRHGWATSLSLFTFMHWRRKWQPTSVFLPGESQGWGSLVGCRLWGRTESDTTEVTQQQQQQQVSFWPYLCFRSRFERSEWSGRPGDQQSSNSPQSNNITKCSCFPFNIILYFVSLVWPNDSKLWIISSCRFCIWPFSLHLLRSLICIITDISFKIKQKV